MTGGSTGESDDKAGAYAIQGIAAQFVEKLNGSFSGVMGLPLYETVRLLKQCGVTVLRPTLNQLSDQGQITLTK